MQFRSKTSLYYVGAWWMKEMALTSRESFFFLKEEPGARWSSSLSSVAFSTLFFPCEGLAEPVAM